MMYGRLKRGLTPFAGLNDLPNEPADLLQSKRLLQTWIPRARQKILCLATQSVPRHQDHPRQQLRVPALDLPVQPLSIPTRHADVGDNHSVAVLPQLLSCHLVVLRHLHPLPIQVQYLRQYSSNCRLVIHDENGLPLHISDAVIKPPSLGVRADLRERLTRVMIAAGVSQIQANLLERERMMSVPADHGRASSHPTATASPAPAGHRACATPQPGSRPSPCHPLGSGTSCSRNGESAAA
jgi:hypothetical protein